jgi:hypothetical protein
MIWIARSSRPRLFWGTAGECLLLGLASVAYVTWRVAYEERLAARVIAQQTPGLWGRLRYPLLRSGPLIIGVPEDDQSEGLLREASASLTRLCAGRLPAGSRVWCVRMRAVSCGQAQHFEREQLLLRLKGTVAGRQVGVAEWSTEEVLKETGETHYPHRELLDAARSEIPAGGSVDWLAIFVVPSGIPLGLCSIIRVEASLGSFALIIDRDTRR